MAIPTAQESLDGGAVSGAAQTSPTGAKDRVPLPHPIRHHLINGLIAVSLGNLFFIRRWYDVERLEPRALGYLRAVPIDTTLLWATIISALLVAAVCWLAWTWVEKHSTLFRRRFGQAVFLLMMWISAESVRRYWNSEGDHFDWGSNLALAVIEGLLACGIVMLFFGRLRILRAARRSALVLTLMIPAFAFDFISSSFNLADNLPLFQNLPNLPALPVSSTAPRVIWLIFDELDQRIAFEARPADLQLPELDRLRSESLSSSRAIETDNWTAVALPSLISGRIFKIGRMVNPRTVMLRASEDQPEVDWRKEPNIFARARLLKVNTGLVGWHHPYCRVFGDEVVRCFTQPSSHSSTALVHEVLATRVGLVGTVGTLFHRAGLNIADLFRDSAHSISERSNETTIQREQQGQYMALRDHTYEYAVDPRLGFVFAHLPTPHMYPIYNRRGHNFDLSGARDYFDNLALVDRTVGELRASLEKAGLWDRTAILLTADHGFRPDNWRGHMGWTPEIERLTAGGTSLTVPLMLKLPGESKAVTFDGQVSNVVSGDLALAVLKGEVVTASQAAEWLGQRATNHQTTTAADPKIRAAR